MGSLRVSQTNHPLTLLCKKQEGLLLQSMTTIDLNKELEYEIYNDFRDFSVAGADFAKAISDVHPEITLENHKKYIDDFYKNNANEIEEKKNALTTALKEIEGDFWNTTEKIFNTKFDQKKYKGYLSIFNCNPRYVDTQTFQVYYKKDLLDMIEVVLHESLHFAFFKYCDNKLSEVTSKYDKNSGPLWELSEIFNVIVLNLPEYRKLLQREEFLFYSDLKEKLEYLKKIWGGKEGVTGFIKTGLEYLDGKE